MFLDVSLEHAHKLRNTFFYQNVYFVNKKNEVFVML